MAMLNRPQPPVETPAQRYARDVDQRRGDWQLNNDGDLVYVAPGSTGGRNDREYLRRGGDVYYTYEVDGTPVRELDVNGRNEREYVDYATGDSAVAGAGVSDRYSVLKGASVAPGNFRTTGKTQTSVALAWDAVAGAESYRLKDGSTVVSAELTGTTYNHTGLTASSTHNYTISTVDAAGNRSTESAVVTVTTNA